MTNEEAIKNIGIAENMLIDCFKLNNSKEDNAILLALAKAQESLLKQIPKMPKKQINGNWYMCQECGEWMSPSCKKNSSYCDQCGQKLDWSKENE